MFDSYLLLQNGEGEDWVRRKGNLELVAAYVLEKLDWNLEFAWANFRHSHCEASLAVSQVTFFASQRAGHVVAKPTLMAGCSVVADCASTDRTFNTEVSVWVEVVCFVGTLPGLDIENCETRQGNRICRLWSGCLCDRYRKHDPMGDGSTLEVPLEVNNCWGGRCWEISETHDEVINKLLWNRDEVCLWDVYLYSLIDNHVLEWRSDILQIKYDLAEPNIW